MWFTVPVLLGTQEVWALVDKGEAQLLSSIDLMKGYYWQTPLAPEAKEDNFVTPSGLYHFVKMPFGLHGAAASF